MYRYTPLGAALPLVWLTWSEITECFLPNLFQSFGFFTVNFCTENHQILSLEFSLNMHLNSLF